MEEKQRPLLERICYVSNISESFLPLMVFLKLSVWGKICLTR